MDVCLTKPVDSRELLATLHRIMAGSVLRLDENRSTRPVLVVDDVEINRAVATKQLSKLGPQCDTAENGDQALALAKHGDYAAILIDILMPAMGGMEFAQELRRWEQSQDRRTPVIAMTGHADPEDRNRYIAAGMDDVLGKPVSIERLSTVLGKWRALPISTNHNPPPPPDGEEQVNVPVDLQFLSEIIGDTDETVLFALLDLFTSEFPGLLEKLDGAIAANDAQTVHDCAHAAKSAAMNAAAKSLVVILENLESGARSEDWTGFAQQSERLKLEYARVHDFCLSRRPRN